MQRDPKPKATGSRLRGMTSEETTSMSATTANAGPAPTAANMTGFRPPNLALATIGISLASFMQVLDITIANVSLPTISRQPRRRAPTRRRGSSPRSR
jgi:hypothetical protein